jgi:hypothetical protein
MRFFKRFCLEKCMDIGQSIYKTCHTAPNALRSAAIYPQRVSSGPCKEKGQRALPFGDVAVA